MTTVWWEAFDTHVREWLRADDESMHVWEQFQADGRFGPLQDMARRGQVGANSDELVGVWEAFLYQRAHINAFGEVLKGPLAGYPKSGKVRRAGVIDVGCGTGTVAFAFHELFGDRVRLHYTGVDHHESSRERCDAMVADIPTVDEWFVTDDLDAAVQHAIDDWPDMDRVFVTASYLLYQNSHGDGAEAALTNAVAEVATRIDDSRLVLVDVPQAERIINRLIERLEAAELTVDRRRKPDRYRYDLAFPDLEGETFRQTLRRDAVGAYLIVRQ